MVMLRESTSATVIDMRYVGLGCSGVSSRAQVNPKYIAALEERGMEFVGQDLNAERMEIMQLKGVLCCVLTAPCAELTLPGHPYFVAVQFHPEFLTRPLVPSPPFLGLPPARSPGQSLHRRQASSWRRLASLRSTLPRSRRRQQARASTPRVCPHR